MTGTGFPADAHREPLGRNTFVYVTPRHTFNTDTLLLADFAAPKAKEICADLGTGCGTIPLWWAERCRPTRVIGIELQEEACQLARRSALENGDQDFLTIRQGDIRALPDGDFPRDLHLITCNPPYQAAGTGILSGGTSEQTARHETACTLEDLARTAQACLRWGGRLCLCHRPHRLTDVMTTLRAFSLEPKRLQLVQQRQEKDPFLFLLEARRGGNPGIRLLPTLFLQDDKGKDTPAFRRILGDYRQNGREKEETI